MEKIKRILLPTDFSETSKDALDYGIKLASKLNARVVLMNVFYMPITSEGTVLSFARGFMKEYEQEIIDKLKDLNRFFPLLNELEVDYAVKSGYVEFEIMKAIEFHNIDLLVMGTTGGNAFKDFFGSSTSYLIHKVACPVISVPRGIIYSDIEKILLAIDFQSLHNKSVISSICSFAAHNNADLDILNVVKNEKDAEKNKEAFQKADTYLNNGVTTNLHFKIADDVEEGILDFLNRQQYGMLAMIPEKHNLLEDLIHKSLTHEMILHTRLPLLTMHE